MVQVIKGEMRLDTNSHTVYVEPNTVIHDVIKTKGEFIGIQPDADAMIDSRKVDKNTPLTQDTVIEFRNPAFPRHRFGNGRG